jgi:hypothetical protein
MDLGNGPRYDNMLEEFLQFVPAMETVDVLQFVVVVEAAVASTTEDVVSCRAPASPRTGGTS